MQTWKSEMSMKVMSEIGFKFCLVNMVIITNKLRTIVEQQDKK